MVLEMTVIFLERCKSKEEGSGRGMRFKLQGMLFGVYVQVRTSIMLCQLNGLRQGSDELFMFFGSVVRAEML